MNTFEQGLLTYLTAAQLGLIQSHHIGIGGAGGLGSNVALLLARSGFNRFTLIDSDTVEASNLNRQTYIIQDIGRDKVTCLAEQMLLINPDIQCTAIRGRWRPDPAPDPLAGVTIAVEAFDDAAGKAGFIDFYAPRVRRVVSGSGLAGNDPAAPLTVSTLGNVSIVGYGSPPASRDNPPLAPRVAGCASRMAEVILEFALLGPAASP